MLLSKHCNWCLRHELFVTIVAYYYKINIISMLCVWTLAQSQVHNIVWPIWLFIRRVIKHKSNNPNFQVAEIEKKSSTCLTRYHRPIQTIYPFVFSFFLIFPFVCATFNIRSFPDFLHIFYCDRFERILRCMLATGSFPRNYLRTSCTHIHM